MQAWAEEFYKSRAWKQCREAYAKKQGGICELCWQEGRAEPGEIVHHLVVLSPSNVNDPEITLSEKNLQLLCREHHAAVHRHKPARYRLDDMGRVIFVPENEKNL